MAALAVVATHYSYYLGIFHPATAAPAVDFFFMLSGFVVSYRYEGSLHNGSLKWKRFMLVRLVRLYPLYCLGIMSGALAIWLLQRPSTAPATSAFFTTFIANLFMLPMPIIWPDTAPGLESANMMNIQDLFPLNFPTWSLFFEVVVNLGYAMLVLQLTNRFLTMIIITSFLGLLGTGYMSGTLEQGTHRYQFLGGSARVTFGFCVGVAQSRSWLVRKTKISLHPLLLFILLLLPMMVKLERLMLARLYELFILGIYIPILLWLGAGSRPSETWLLVSRVLGALSYPIYVIHVPIWNMLRACYRWQGNEFLHEHEPFSGFILIVTLCFIASSLDRFVDRPLRRQLSKALL